MIIGMVFISVLIIPYLERVFLLFFTKVLVRKDKRLYPIAVKNLQSHEKRNTKTAVMFTITLSFLIFAGSTFKLISHLITSQIESFVGTDLMISSSASSSFLD